LSRAQEDLDSQAMVQVEKAKSADMAYVERNHSRSGVISSLETITLALKYNTLFRIAPLTPLYVSTEARAEFLNPNPRMRQETITHP
jgi:hypothetical protein